MKFVDYCESNREMGRVCVSRISMKYCKLQERTAKMKIQQQNEMKTKNEMEIKNEMKIQQQQQQEKRPWRLSQAKYHRWEFLNL